MVIFYKKLEGSLRGTPVSYQSFEEIIECHYSCDTLYSDDTYVRDLYLYIITRPRYNAFLYEYIQY